MRDFRALIFRYKGKSTHFLISPRQDSPGPGSLPQTSSIASAAAVVLAAATANKLLVQAPAAVADSGIEMTHLEGQVGSY